VRLRSTWFQNALLGAVAVAAAAYFVHLRDPPARELASLRALAKDRPFLPDARVPEGPVVFRARVASDARFLSPAGTPGAAWVGWVGSWVGAGKSRSYVTACTVGVVAGLEVEAGGERLTIDVAGASLRVAASTTYPGASPGTLALDFEALTSASDGATPSIPAPAATACAKAIEGIRGTPLYREAVLQPGVEVDVVGCRKGATVRPCGDGRDYVTSGSVRQRIDSARDAQAMLLLVATAGFAAALGLSGFAATRLAVRARPGEEGA
jgi:hypothetical protein